VDRTLSRLRKPAVALLAAVGLPVVLVVAVFLLLRAVGPGDLDPASVERDVAAEFEERGGVTLDLTCPDDMPRESGGVFLCRGTTAEGERLVVEIQIADPADDVDYRWLDYPA
jgi:hypothetical protein